MIALLQRARKSVAAFGLAAAAGILAACQPVSMGGTGPAINPNAPVPVALLVPGASGQASDQLLARSLENAARLAIADLGGVQIDLRVYQTSGQAGSAGPIAQRAVAEGARVILGPLFAQEANAAGVAVAATGVNVMSFSNNTDIAGGNVFVLGPTFENTANRLVRYAAGQGQRRVMIIHDRTPGGEAGRNAIARAAAGSGATVVAQSGYEFSQNGVTQAAPSIVATARSSGADALFFTADTAGSLPMMTQLLREQGLTPDQARYLGLTRWDIPAATLSLPGLQGGWFALPDPALYNAFQGRYQAAYGSAPHPVASLAYDGIAAVGALIKSGRADALSRNSLTQSSGFAGVGGVFRLRPDGTNERALAVAEIRNRQVVVIDPAPRNFSGSLF
ncbi:penicillin-binding protein activator [Falsigemmobacter faecalis]|uniref:Penicillin-binding protein activator n=1 Tax=Falsigemmobacter faecalis TaxID=2488730 RepID=A0A3P3DR62_9RHOB|nr:penicillin-binding protein activator [Falsigemmobacter faecalis]RRH76709.1 penicillin-binding protein activator [Falsigemmobacter faecalis]